MKRGPALNQAFALLLVGTLAGCGGGSSNSSTDDPAAPTPTDPTTPTAFEQKADALAALNSAWGSTDATAVGSMPTVGTASYAGTAAFGTDPTLGDATIYSDVALSANFADGSVGGSLTNFEAETASIPGTLTLADGVISDNGFTATASGALTQGASSGTVNLGIEGGFVGSAANAIVAESAGAVFPDGQTYYGTIVAEQ